MDKDRNKIILQLQDSVLNEKTRFLPKIFGRGNYGRDFKVGPRTIKDFLIYFIEKGHLDIEVGNQYFTLEPYRLFFLYPDIKHLFRLSFGSPNALINYFRFEFPLNQLSIPSEGFLVFHEDRTLLSNIHELVKRNEVPSSQTAYIKRCYMGLIFSRIYQLENRNNDDVIEFAWKKRTSEWLQTQASKWPSIELAACKMNLNTDYFGRKFKKVFGTPFSIWMKKERINQAAIEVSESSQNISTIAARYGYDDIYFFSRQFKEVIGMGPRAYRKNT